MMIPKKFNYTCGRRLGGGKEYKKLFASFMDDLLFQFVINRSWVLFEVTFVVFSKLNFHDGLYSIIFIHYLHLLSKSLNLGVKVFFEDVLILVFIAIFAMLSKYFTFF